LTGSQYGQALRQRLAQVKENSEDLMTEASKSHIHDSHLCKYAVSVYIFSVTDPRLRLAADAITAEANAEVAAPD
jgi:hypothetical protein